MTKKRETYIHFVTWPDGKIMEGSQTSVSESMAVANALRTWLIPQFFPDLNLTQAYYGSLSQLWVAMEKAGFRVQSVSTDCDGVSY